MLYLVIIYTVTGISIAELQSNNPSSSTKLQPLYLKFRPKLVGKITYKVQDKALYKALNNDDDDDDDRNGSLNEVSIIALIQQALVNVGGSVGVQVYKLSVLQALELYGKDTLDTYGISSDAENVSSLSVSLTYIPNLYFALSSTASDVVEYKALGSIQLDYVGNGDKLATSISLAKKTGVVEFGFKFEAFGSSIDGEYWIYVSFCKSKSFVIVCVLFPIFPH